jgi:hypothetical protein
MEDRSSLGSWVYRSELLGSAPSLPISRSLCSLSDLSLYLSLSLSLDISLSIPQVSPSISGSHSLYLTVFVREERKKKNEGERIEEKR